jgi:hypothetical protein
MAQKGLRGVTSSVRYEPGLYGMMLTYMLCSNFIHLYIFNNVYVEFICFSRAPFMNGLT